MVKSCTAIVFVANNFLLTSSDMFAVGCIAQPQNTPKNEPMKIRHVELVYCVLACSVS